MSRGPALPRSAPSSSNSGSGFFICLTMGALSSHARTSFRAVLERFPNHRWPRLPLLNFPFETKFSSFRKIESRGFPGGAVVENPPAKAGSHV